jgi:hypothetical protein
MDASEARWVTCDVLAAPHFRDTHVWAGGECRNPEPLGIVILGQRMGQAGPDWR